MTNKKTPEQIEEEDFGFSPPIRGDEEFQFSVTELRARTISKVIENHEDDFKQCNDNFCEKLLKYENITLTTKELIIFLDTVPSPEFDDHFETLSKSGNNQIYNLIIDYFVKLRYFSINISKWDLLEFLLPKAPSQQADAYKRSYYGYSEEEVYLKEEEKDCDSDENIEYYEPMTNMSKSVKILMNREQ